MRKLLPGVMRGKEGRYLAYGKTRGGRLLFVVWVLRHRTTKIITARDMTQKERRFYNIRGVKDESAQV